MRRNSWDPEPAYLARQLAPLRRGHAGAQRERVRQILLSLMGFSPAEARRYPPGTLPGHTPAAHMNPEAAMVAQDALLELGYDAAAEDLGRWPTSSHSAKEALEILEAGPPSVYLDHYLVFKRPMYRVEATGMHDVVIARRVGEHQRPWYRFSVGKPVHDQRGRWVGWDPEAGFTFQRCAKTLAEAKSPDYRYGA